MNKTTNELLDEKEQVNEALNEQLRRPNYLYDEMLVSALNESVAVINAEIEMTKP